MTRDPAPLLAALLADPAVGSDEIARELAFVVTRPTGTTTAGHPFLDADAYARFRDHVPHILSMGPRVLDALTHVAAAAARVAGGAAAVDGAVRVVRGCVQTAAITAPPDLWLIHHVGTTLARAGLLASLLAGERIDPSACDVLDAKGVVRRADPRELEADLTFLASRGLVDVVGSGAAARFVAPTHARARETLAGLLAAARLAVAWPADISRLWLSAFRGEALSAETRALLLEVGAAPLRPRDASVQDTWIPTMDEVECGFRLVPIILALRAAGLHTTLASEAEITPEALCARDVGVAHAALNALAAAGLVRIDAPGVLGAGRTVRSVRSTATGKRVAEKGAGPMGIIEAYHPYMAHLHEILVEGRTAAWVTRGANIAASQDANRESFQKTNDALDAFCADTGFTYKVFIEHAIGRGEATRQRYAKDGDALAYFGADLEDAAIDACLLEQRAGRLPAAMRFVRNADIGNPAPLVDAIRSAGSSTDGAVMIVGNGFHEVRGRDDEGMVAVFRGYCDAGIVLLFTEENALRVDDLLATAWNTYHAGFRYVHEKSGQGLRPAEPGLPSTIGRALQKSWRECAETAGYVRVDKYSSRSRTVYPLAPSTRTNPTISANHFCVPARLMPKG